MNDQPISNEDALPYKVVYQDPQGNQKILAAFALQVSHDTFRARCYGASPQTQVSSLLDEAITRTHFIEETDTARQVLEREGALPYDALLREFQRGIACLEVLKQHEHRWERNQTNGLTFCLICEKIQ